MKKLALLCLLASFNVYSLEVSKGLGESSFSSNKDRMTACSIAENKAINDALINYAGKEFAVTKETRCIDTQSNAYCDYLKEITSHAAGSVRSIVDRFRRINDNTCFVEVLVEVEKTKSINAFSTTKRIYKDGENIELNVKIGQPSYLYVFNLHDEGISLLFPNEHNRDPLIDDRFVFPSGFITAETKKDISNETLLILFSKRRQNVSSDISKDELVQLIKSIPNFEKKVVQHNLVIKRSER